METNDLIFSKESMTEIKALMTVIQDSYKEAIADPKYNGELDMLLAAVENLKESYQIAETAKGKLTLREQARIAADLNLFMQFMKGSEDFEEEMDYFEEEEEFEDEEDLETPKK